MFSLSALDYRVLFLAGMRIGPGHSGLFAVLQHGSRLDGERQTFKSKTSAVSIFLFSFLIC